MNGFQLTYLILAVLAAVLFAAVGNVNATAFCFGQAVGIVIGSLIYSYLHERGK